MSTSIWYSVAVYHKGRLVVHDEYRHYDTKGGKRLGQLWDAAEDGMKIEIREPVPVQTVVEYA